MRCIWYNLATVFLIFLGQDASEMTVGKKCCCQLLFHILLLLPPAELRWTSTSSSVVLSLSATVLITSLPVVATAILIVVYVWSMQYTFSRTRHMYRRNTDVKNTCWFDSKLLNSFLGCEEKEYSHQLTVILISDGLFLLQPFLSIAKLSY